MKLKDLITLTEAKKKSDPEMDALDLEDEKYRLEIEKYKAGAAAKRHYEQLISDLEKIEAQTGLYLVDVNVDHENVQTGDLSDRESKEYWDAMYSSACMNAGTRAEEQGKDINTLLGRTIY